MSYTRAAKPGVSPLVRSLSLSSSRIECSARVFGVSYRQSERDRERASEFASRY